MLSGVGPLCRGQVAVPAYGWTKLFTGSGRLNQGKVVTTNGGAGRQMWVAKGAARARAR